MSQSTPAKPSPQTVQAISPPWYARAGTWTALATGFISLLVAANDLSGTLITIWGPFMSPHQHGLALAVASTLAALTGHLGGWRGVNSAARVQENTIEAAAQVAQATAVQVVSTAQSTGDLGGTPSLLPQGPGARNPGA
jgi:hypothetical protein